ncbi:SLOG family protein [Streptomyces sp. CA-135486]|uniref:SLOG family protein n=1 Tax=Streptomyces sp. CA-135486 TaxID=3240049 RepID=UPI003D91C1F9
MRVIVTGSRKWTDKAAVWDALNQVYKERGPFRVVHGACSTGADAFAHEWVAVASRLVYVEEEQFPAAWDRGKRAGPERNERMIEAGADLVLAFRSSREAWDFHRGPSKRDSEPMNLLVPPPRHIAEAIARWKPGLWAEENDTPRP